MLAASTARSWWHVLRKRDRRARRDVESGLMREEREDVLALQGASAALDPSDRGVAVLDGEGEIYPP